MKPGVYYSLLLQYLYPQRFSCTDEDALQSLTLFGEFSPALPRMRGGGGKC